MRAAGADRGARAAPAVLEIWQPALGLCAINARSKPRKPAKLFVGKNLLCISRSDRIPVPGGPPEEAEEDEETEADDAEDTPPTKDVLRGISAKSRQSLAKLLSVLEWGGMGESLHVTLTYWKDWPRTKAQLQQEKKRIKRTLGQFGCGIWRLEYQERGAPHWHVLLWVQGRDAEQVIQLIQWWWAGDCAHSSRWANSHPQGVYVTRGTEVKSTWYLAMHAAKGEQSPLIAVGRWWGFINRADLLQGRNIAEEGEISAREHIWWARLYRRATGCKVRQQADERGIRPNGFTWFLPRSNYLASQNWIAKTVAAGD
jgi:hypothetical protein